MEPTEQQLTALRRDAEVKLDEVARDADELRERLDPKSIAAAGRAGAKRAVRTAGQQVADRLDHSPHWATRFAGSAAYTATRRPGLLLAVATATLAAIWFARRG